MRRRGEQRTREHAALLLAALALAGCATETAPATPAPNRDERTAADAADYEADPVRDAVDLLPPDLLSGAHHRVEPLVVTSGFSNRYVIASDYGEFEARGDRMLRTRIHEIEALAALDAMSRTTAFADAAGNALKSPFVAAWNLIASPVDTIVGVPIGAWSAIERASQLARGERSELEDSEVLALIGFEAKKRQIASELGVDPYSSNKVLQKQLNRFAWAAYMGGLPYLFVPFVGDDDFQKEISEPEDEIAEILSIYSPEDLRRLNRIELAVMGVPAPAADALIGHPWYGPRQATALVDALAALDLARNRAAFVEAAVGAQSEDDAAFFELTAELMRTYSDRVSRILEIASPERIPMGYTESGVLVLALPADYATWSPATAALARAIDAEAARRGNVARRELVLSGAASPLVREKLEALDIVVIERAFEQLDGEAAQRSEAAP